MPGRGGAAVTTTRGAMTVLVQNGKPVEVVSAPTAAYEDVRLPPTISDRSRVPRPDPRALPRQRSQP